MKPLSYLFTAVAVLLLSLSAQAASVDPTGAWKWTSQGRGGNPGFEQTLKLELKEGKLTGTLLGGETPRGKIPDVAISEGTFKDGSVTFSVAREFNGNKMVTKYEGKLDGDTITGTSERPGRDGGAPQKREWVAKREKPAAPSA